MESGYWRQCHKLFELLGVIGDALVAKEAATILGDEHIVFDADATKVLKY